MTRLLWLFNETRGLSVEATMILVMMIVVACAEIKTTLHHSTTPEDKGRVSSYLARNKLWDIEFAVEICRNNATGANAGTANTSAAH